MATFSATISYNPQDLQKSFEDFVADVADEIERDARSNTPVRTGRARAGWTKSVNREQFTVENRVPYIGKLEAGASRQAPRGIIGPTLTQVKGKYK